MTHIATIPKNKREVMVVELSEWNGHNLAALRVWVKDNDEELKPTTKGVTFNVSLLPEVLSDRGRDNWRALIAIADLAGGDWPKLARQAAMDLSGNGQDDASRSNDLLGDARDIFDRLGVDRIFTPDFISALFEVEESSWADYKWGKPITSEQVARLLRPYKIKSHNVRIGYRQGKGYERKDFEEAWARYLDPVLSTIALNPVLPVPPSQSANSSTVSCSYCGTGSEEEQGEKTTAVPIKLLKESEKNGLGRWDGKNTEVRVEGHTSPPIPANGDGEDDSITEYAI
ncbi:MAG: DUF3631 domain-containing protein [Alphaproteobacteria bacterium]|nr:DUF3631 domain-containing protein [Alphaproteobacteria bacterium]